MPLRPHPNADFLRQFLTGMRDEMRQCDLFAGHKFLNDAFFYP